MANISKKIREFIYIDVPKLYSLYSQIFEGITDRIVEERIHQFITGDAQKSILLQASAESKALEASRHVESRVLYDHMYNRLESKLEPTLLDCNNIKFEDMKSLFLERPLVKVSGRAEIEDYERLNDFIGKYNDLGTSISYLGFKENPEINRRHDELNKKIRIHSSKSCQKSSSDRTKPINGCYACCKRVGSLSRSKNT